MSNIDVTLSHQELGHLIDALARAAARHESTANFNPGGRNAGDHDRAAAEMRKLRVRFMRCLASTELAAS